MSGVEVVTRRRKWTAEEKTALLAEVEAEGGRVSVVARRHGISDSLLYNWRSAWRAAMAIHAPAPVEFMPLGVIGRLREEDPAVLAVAEPSALPVSRRKDLPRHSPRPPSEPDLPAFAEARVGLIEIELGTGTRLRVDAFVNEKALSRVLRAMKGGA